MRGGGGGGGGKCYPLYSVNGYPADGKICLLNTYLQQSWFWYSLTVTDILRFCQTRPVQLAHSMKFQAKVKLSQLQTVTANSEIHLISYLLDNNHSWITTCTFNSEKKKKITKLLTENVIKNSETYCIKHI